MKRPKGSVLPTKYKRRKRMVIDVTKVMLNMRGEELSDSDGPITFRSILVNALNMPDPKGAIAGTEKHKRFRLANKIWAAKETINLAVEEVALLKDLVDKAYPSPLIVGQAWDILDPETPPKP